MSEKQGMGKSPGFWLYPGDLERDYQILSLRSQGLAIRMLCWMHGNESHRGFLELPTGEPMVEQDIASKVGKPAREVRAALEEMARVGLYSQDDRGCIYSRRMAREYHISEVRRAAANRRMEASKRAADGKFAGDFAPANQLANEIDDTKTVRTKIGTSTKPPREGEYSDVANGTSTIPNHASDLVSTLAQNFAGCFAPANTPPKGKQNPTVTVSDSDSVSTTPVAPTETAFGSDAFSEFRTLYEQLPKPTNEQDWTEACQVWISEELDNQWPAIREYMQWSARPGGEWWDSIRAGDGRYIPSPARLLWKKPWTRTRKTPVGPEPQQTEQFIINWTQHATEDLVWWLGRSDVTPEARAEIQAELERRGVAA